jgi:hypothetical protein
MRSFTLNMSRYIFFYNDAYKRSTADSLEVKHLRIVGGLLGQSFHKIRQARFRPRKELRRPRKTSQ